MLDLASNNLKGFPKALFKIKSLRELNYCSKWFLEEEQRQVQIALEKSNPNIIFNICEMNKNQ